MKTLLYSLVFWTVQAKAQQLALPLKLPPMKKPGPAQIYIPAGDGKNLRTLTIVPALQNELRRYLRKNGNPIAAALVVDASNGHILAMVQGKSPLLWGAKTHSALFNSFPAASLFKLVPTIAALELGQMQPEKKIPYLGSCTKVNPRGLWLKDLSPQHKRKMSLSRAFALSCNSFFARLSIKHVGLEIINKFAHKLLWGKPIPSDFIIANSPFHPPKPASSSIHTVGRYAAGFGMVGLSLAHAAWINLMIARDGHPIALKIFRDPYEQSHPHSGFANQPLLSAELSKQLRKMMAHTVRSGTATSVFRQRLYKRLPSIGGKTGTLNSRKPAGLATRFSGVMPVDKPQVVVSAIVINPNKKPWIIKGVNLAAEALRLWQIHVARKTTLLSKKSKN